MSSTPPDPGHAIDAAHAYPYDATLHAFDTPDGARFLSNVRDTWILTATRDRVITRDTYDKLRAAGPVLRGNRFDVCGTVYYLVDDVSHATATPA